MTSAHAARLLATVLVVLLGAPAAASSHGGEDAEYRTVITEVEPEGLPIDVRVTKGDQMRFENQGEEELTICGYLPTCEPYAQLGPEGVLENRNSKAYFANRDTERFGEIPDGAGDGRPEWKLVRRAPAFFRYHDHRSHWMGHEPPGSVDTGDPEPQLINTYEIDFRYGDTPGVVTGRLEYVGGRSWFAAYGEYLLTGAAVLVMLGVFAFDARRRRREARRGADGSSGEAASAEERA